MNIRWLLSFALLCTPLARLAAEPLLMRDLTPTKLIFAAPFDPGSVPSSDGLRVDFSSSLANDYRPAQSGSEALLIDAETRRDVLRLFRSLDDCWVGGLELTHIDHSGGQLDRFIEDWHDRFNLPQHGRDTAPDDRMQISYQRDGQMLLDLRESARGFGDTTLSLHRREQCGDARWQLGVKLPSGDADKLTGSGAADAWLGLLDDGLLDAAGDWRWRSGGWLQWLGDSTLDLPQRDAALFASGDLAWRALPSLQFNLQLQIHSPLYDSALHEIGGWSGGLLMGGQWGFAPDWLFEAAVLEDIYVQSTSDVVFHLAVRHQH
jgi:hypothetical protein